jgi:hypothetical protein
MTTAKLKNVNSRESGIYELYNAVPVAIPNPPNPIK